MYHQGNVRRALSILLVLFFSLGPLAATLSASDDASLPACCRRHGAHHCAMTMETAAAIAIAASNKTSVKAPSTCPAFPGAACIATSASHALVATSASLPALLAQPHSPAAARASARLTQLRTRVSRGPPATTPA